MKKILASYGEHGQRQLNNQEQDRKASQLIQQDYYERRLPNAQVTDDNGEAEAAIQSRQAP